MIVPPPSIALLFGDDDVVWDLHTYYVCMWAMLPGRAPAQARLLIVVGDHEASLGEVDR